jgi:Xaa-Pro dipeptidase
MAQGMREQRLREALHSAGLDLLVCRLPEHVLLLCGYWPMNGMSFAFFPVAGDPVLIVPEGEQRWAEAGRWSDVRTFAWATLRSAPPLESVAGHLRDLRAGLHAGGHLRVGYEGSAESLAPPHAAGESVAVAQPTREMLRQVFGDGLVDATALLEEQRAVKTPEELEGVRQAVAAADLGCAAFGEWLRPGAIECEGVAAVEAAVMSRGLKSLQGATRIRAWATILAGAASSEAWLPFQVSRARPIAEGESAVLELGVVVDGFWADLTRTYVAGKPSARQQHIHEIVLAAHDAAIAAIRPGRTGAEVDAAARQVVEAAGFGPAFPHQTGHGLGFRYHESLPLLHPAYERPLAAGMVTSVEPGIYLPGEFGLRIEDDILVTESGAQSLSQAPRALIPLSHPL